MSKYDHTRFHLDRVLKFARQLTYVDPDDLRRRGLYGAMMQTAIALDALQDAVRSYDEILEVVAADREENDQ